MADQEDAVMADAVDGVNASATVGAGAVGGGSALPSPLLSIDEVLRNDVEVAAAHHQQVKTRPLSSLEQFFVRVHEVYQHQTLQKHTQEAQAAALAKAQSGSVAATSAVAPIAWPFGSMETKLFQAKYQVDNIVTICEQLLRSSTSHQRGAAAATAPPMLSLVEKNTEMQDAKIKEQLQLHKDQQRAEREAAAATAMTDEARTALEADLQREEEEAEFTQGDGDGSEEVLVVPDAGDATISLETRRRRLGTLLMHKRRQYVAATDVLQRGREQLAKSIEGERKFLHGVSHLAKYWTIRTIQSDSTAPVNPSAPHKGPLFNPYQNGLPAGSTSAYPSMMIDYRIGSLDISLDRGKAWLYRNDAGDVFVDEAIGKDESSSASVQGTSDLKADATAPAAGPTAKSEVADEDASMKDESAASPPAAAAAAAAAAVVPSWLNVSSRLHRAQHQLLYKHLYNQVVSEAREWRIAFRREQQAKNPAASSSAPTVAGGVASGASSSSAFHPPPSLQSSRPWSITDITPRQITLQVAGFKDAIAINWDRGIGVGFEVTDAPEGGEGALGNGIPPHLSRLICNHSLTILLDHTLKNSLGQRPLLEVLQTSSLAAAGESTFNRDPIVSTTGLGASGTGQEETWPARPISILHFVVMSVTHWRLVREVRAALRALAHQQQTLLAPGDFIALPPFRIKPARTNQPHLHAFTVLVGKRFVLEATIRGTQFQVIVSLPSAHPSPLTLAAFGQSTSPPISWETPVADTIHITSVTHFVDVLKTALSWHKQA